MSDKDALCANCGAHLENWRETFGHEHDCKQPTDLFGPLRPPRGVEEPAPAKSYVCNTAGECGVPECNAAKSHAHFVALIHEPRHCHFTETRVRCEEEPAGDSLRGVWVSGKAVEVLSMLKGMDPDEWDQLWAMVTGKTTRHTDAERVMQEANGAEDTIRNLGANDHEHDLRRIVISALAKWEKRPRPALGSVVNEAVARIVELPRPETP